MHYMDLLARKPVFRVSDKASFKPVSSATETILKIEISPVARLHMILSKKRITKALIRCADAQAGLSLCCSQPPEDRFSRDKAHITRSGDIHPCNLKLSLNSWVQES